MGKESKGLFNYISCSRNGLRESDLKKLLNDNWKTDKFENIRCWFQSYLREEGSNKQWNLSHSVFRKSIYNKIKPEDRKIIHNSICSMLNKLPIEDNLRVSEIMYHMMEEGNAMSCLDYILSSLSPEEREYSSITIAESILRSTSDNKAGLNWVNKILNYAHKTGKLINFTISMNDNVNDILNKFHNYSNKCKIAKYYGIMIKYLLKIHGKDKSYTKSKYHLGIHRSKG